MMPYVGCNVVKSKLLLRIGDEPHEKDNYSKWCSKKDR